ncbi:hypothetical protein AGMMS50268_11540 [Spirochaetia bacterium]|nr:hypothetical protein AGMMS50268_11540 [Spirochaetia bacterium]
MKKLIVSVIILAALSAPLFAQKIPEGKESEYFYVNVPLERIYPYKTGYVVEYQKGPIQLARAYLPLEWFRGAADKEGGPAKGEVLYMSSGSSWPYLAVYYKNGEFSHVRLYVRKSHTHETWGNIPAGVNLDDRFENVDDLKLQF